MPFNKMMSFFKGVSVFFRSFTLALLSGTERRGMPGRPPCL